MHLDLSNISAWIWIIVGVVILVLIFRFFSHIVHFIMNFFWHSCLVVVVLLVLFFILRALHVF